MYLERKQDLSVYYCVKDAFDSVNASFVTIVDEFPNSGSNQPVELTIPTVSIENSVYSVRPFELGNREGVDIRTWIITIFGDNKSQTDDFGYLIKNTFQQGIPVYDYDEGFPPDVSPTQIGAMDWLTLEYTPIRIFPETQGETSKVYWRGQVKLVARYNQTT